MKRYLAMAYSIVRFPEASEREKEFIVDFLVCPERQDCFLLTADDSTDSQVCVECKTDWLLSELG